MKKILFSLALILGLSSFSFAQLTPESCPALNTATNACSLKGEDGTGITYHKLSWTLSGNNSGSTVLLQYSDDGGVNYSTLITGTSTSNGVSAMTAGVHSKWRILLSGFTATSPGAFITAVHTAYYDNISTGSFTGNISQVGGVSTPNCNTTVPCLPVQVYDSNGHPIIYNDPVTVNVGTSTPFLSDATTNTAKTVVGSAAVLNSYFCWNPNATVEYIQIYDSASVTVGTTVPVLSFGIPPTQSGNLAGINVAFANSIKVAATTTVKNATAPGTALDCNFGYK